MRSQSHQTRVGDRLRVLRRVSFACVLGLISTLIVAEWLCNYATVNVRSVDTRTGSLWRAPESGVIWMTEGWGDGRGVTLVTVFRIKPEQLDDPGPYGVDTSSATWSPLGWSLAFPGGPPETRRELFLFGLPLRCVWGSNFNDGVSPTRTVIHWHQLGGYSLATGLLWPGLLLDALCFGVIWYPVLFAPGLIRRARRRRRGQCTACGYNLAATPPGQPCPECGVVPRPATRSVIAKPTSEACR